MTAGADAIPFGGGLSRLMDNECHPHGAGWSATAGRAIHWSSSKSCPGLSAIGAIAWRWSSSSPLLRD